MVFPVTLFNFHVAHRNSISGEYRWSPRVRYDRWKEINGFLSMLQVACSVTYLLPAYVLTGQPMELFRFAYFSIILIVTSLTAQSTGFLLGATLPVNVSIIVSLHWSVYFFFFLIYNFSASFRYPYSLVLYFRCYSRYSDSPSVWPIYL